MTDRSAAAFLHRMVNAINNHDLSALVSCFHSDYQSIQPVHPERSFQGLTRVAENWRWVFERYSDFRVQVLDFAVRDETIWSEWLWEGTDPDEVEVRVRGVMILTIEDDRARVGRLYLEPVRST